MVCLLKSFFRVSFVHSGVEKFIPTPGHRTNTYGIGVICANRGCSENDVRVGVCSTDEALTSCAEFTVQKVTSRSVDPVRRTLCLTETCLVERDPGTYNVVNCKPLCDVRTTFGSTSTYLFCYFCSLLYPDCSMLQYECQQCVVENEADAVVNQLPTLPCCKSFRWWHVS